MASKGKRGCGQMVLGAFLWAIIIIAVIAWWGKRVDDRAQAERARREAMSTEDRAAEDRLRAAKAARAEAAAAAERRHASAIKASEECVRRFLRFPDDAAFPFWEAPDVRSDAGGTLFHVSGKVKAKNAFGAELTSRWETILMLDEAANKWRVVSCEIDGEMMYADQKLIQALRRRK